MRNQTRLSLLLQAVAFGTALFLVGSAAQAQVTGGADLNLAKKTVDQTECAMAKNPANKLQLFALCNSNLAGLFAARSIDGGASWTYPDAADKTIADGDANQGPAACCDPTLAWDSFGNLFIAYINSALTRIEVLLSTDGGATFSNLTSFGPFCVQCPDQPTIVAGNTTDPAAPVAVWIVWHKNAPTGPMVAHGAAVTGLERGRRLRPGADDPRDHGLQLRRRRHRSERRRGPGLPDSEHRLRQRGRSSSIPMPMGSAPTLLQQR